MKPSYKKRDIHRGDHLSSYWPLISLVGVAFLASLAINYSVNGMFFEWMHYFMGVFLTIFALLKLFHPSAFADGFQMYDLLAKRVRGYALIYPFIELLLGLGYLSFIWPHLTYIVTVVVMFFGAAGVILALMKGLDLRCACMGSILDVPLSTVTLTEDIGMGIFALIMLFMS